MQEIIESKWECTKCDKENIKIIADTVKEMLETNAIFNGIVTITNLPTEDPGVPGQLYNDSGTVKVSQ